LTALGVRKPDPDRLAGWWEAHAPAPSPRRQFGARRGEGRAPLPPLLAGAIAARAWKESGITDRADPVPALLVAFGFGDREALPGLRAEAADRVAGRGGAVTWPVACLHLIAESARLGLREMDRLEAAAGRSRGLAARSDKRSRLPDALDALLRAPVLTPKALASRLRVAPQTATALLRVLRDKGVAREVTGRGSFRAFAL
jgi:hypothetical protein